MDENVFWQAVDSLAKEVAREEDGARTVEVTLAPERSQLIRIRIADLGGRLGPCAVFGTLVGDLAEIDPVRALRLNASDVYFGALAAMDDTLVLRETLRLATCDAEEIAFAISELATVADALEKELHGSDEY